MVTIRGNDYVNYLDCGSFHNTWGISKFHIVYLKYIQFLFVIILQLSWGKKCCMYVDGSSVQAAIIKYYRLCYVAYKQETFSSQSFGIQSLSSGCQHGHVRALFWVTDFSF